jgi:hypothetical protein
MVKKRVLMASDSLKTQRQGASCFNPEVFELVFSQGAHDALLKLERLTPEIFLLDEEIQNLDRDQLNRLLIRLPKLHLFWLGSESALGSLKAANVHLLSRPLSPKELLGVLAEITEEEATPVRAMIDPAPFDLMGDEVTANQKMKGDLSSGPFSSFRKVVGSHESPAEEEITMKISPKNFVQEVNFNSPVEAGPKPPIENSFPKESESVQEIAYEKVELWIEKNLESLAERLIKEEIAKKLKF